MKQVGQVPDILIFREFEAFMNKIILRNAVETFKKEYDKDDDEQISVQDEPDDEIQNYHNGKPRTAEFGCTFSNPQIDVGVQTVKEETARKFYTKNENSD